MSPTVGDFFDRRIGWKPFVMLNGLSTCNLIWTRVECRLDAFPPRVDMDKWGGENTEIEGHAISFICISLFFLKHTRFKFYNLALLVSLAAREFLQVICYVLVMFLPECMQGHLSVKYHWIWDEWRELVRFALVDQRPCFPLLWKYLHPSQVSIKATDFF